MRLRGLRARIADRGKPLKPEPELKVVTVSSILDETPEGMYRMDRLRRAESERRAALTQEERELEDILHRQMERSILFGDES